MNIKVISFRNPVENKQNTILKIYGDVSTLNVHFLPGWQEMSH